jgi:hypothetical protein
MKLKILRLFFKFKFYTFSNLSLRQKENVQTEIFILVQVDILVCKDRQFP